MSKAHINTLVRTRQFRILAVVVLAGTVSIGLCAHLLTERAPTKVPLDAPKLDFTGVVDDTFGQENTQSMMIQQQAALESLRHDLEHMKKSLLRAKEERLAFSHENERFQAMLKAQSERMERLSQERARPAPAISNPFDGAAQAQSAGISQASNPFHASSQFPPPSIHFVRFGSASDGSGSKNPLLNPKHYVPSNTSVQAIVLGGADADASVNGQSKNNGVMLFKFIENGRLPNGQRSHLSGCRVSANTYGDISSERAFAALYRLSCARPGEPIIDKEVSGWVFYNGKVGIKGQPLMRDNKIMQWAGISGALSGVASAAQYAQTSQQSGAYGISSAVPAGRIGPFAAFGGASKAAETLSQYYVNRAEQYHPVIQVGAGNVVTIVFKDGFYLDPEASQIESAEQFAHNKARAKGLLMPHDQDSGAIGGDDSLDFSVPPEVLEQIGAQNPQNPQGPQAFGGSAP